MYATVFSLFTGIPYRYKLGKLVFSSNYSISLGSFFSCFLTLAWEAILKVNRIMGTFFLSKKGETSSSSSSYSNLHHETHKLKPWWEKIVIYYLKLKRTTNIMKSNNKAILDKWKYRLRIALVTGTSLIVCCTLILLFMLMVCESHYFYKSDDNPTNSFCFPLYRRLFPSERHKGYPMWPSTIVLTILLIILPCFILIFPISVIPVKNPNKSNKIISRWEKFRVVMTKGDPIIWIWSMILIVLPIMIVLLVLSQKEVKNATGIKLYHAKFSNPLGYLASVVLSFFMVPVTKQSPLLAAIGWSPIQALGIL